MRPLPSPFCLAGTVCVRSCFCALRPYQRRVACCRGRCCRDCLRARRRADCWSAHLLRALRAVASLNVPSGGVCGAGGLAQRAAVPQHRGFLGEPAVRRLLLLRSALHCLFTLLAWRLPPSLPSAIFILTMLAAAFSAWRLRLRPAWPRWRHSCGIVACGARQRADRCILPACPTCRHRTYPTHSAARQRCLRLGFVLFFADFRRL